MFTCKECLKRAVGSLNGKALPKNPNPSRHILQPLQRTYATAAAPTSSSRDASRDQSHHDHTDSNPRVGRSVEWAARKELEYLKDPLHIATRVKRALDKDEFAQAAEITRTASKNTNVAVSWNHLIDYELKKDRIHSAFKLYNEMKKRAQLPNAQTFTIIFRGCANSAHAKLAVAESVKLYNNMISVGRIKPNTVHLNAVLQVCARADDLESMFSILQSSDDPIRAPNNQTYTTILNALRANADKKPTAHVDEKDIQEEKEGAIRRSKAIWEEVIKKWKSGSIIIDEELVCAMGRVLLMGGYLDADAIEGLIEQTMMISKADEKASLQPEATKGTKRTKGTKETKETEATKPTRASIVPVVPTRSTTKAPGAPATTHALPGNNSLSLILTAVEKTGKTTKATKYWNIFTLHYHVVPDPDNWFRLLKVYLRGKNSGRAAASLQAMPREHMLKWHVQYAMKTCLRDNLNRSALDNAAEILKVMKEKLSFPDVDTLRLYLRLAHASKRSFDEEAKRDYDGAMSTWATKLSTVLQNLWVPYQILARKCNSGGRKNKNQHAVQAEVPYQARSKGPSTERPNQVLEAVQSDEFKAKLVDLARKMVAAYDILINGNVTDSTMDMKTLKTRRDSINAFVMAHFEELMQRQVKGKKALDEEDVDDRDFDNNFLDRLE